MSAYICEKEIFDNIINCLAYGQSQSSRGMILYGGRPFATLPKPYNLKHAPQTLEEELEFTRLAFDLYRLNVEAVNQRYNEKNDLNFKLTLSPMKVKPLVEVYKSVKCLRYQCSEGNVPETLLYKALNKFCHFLAHEIVESLPAYRQLKW